MWRCIFATLIINKMLMFPSVSAERPSVSAERKAFITKESCRLLTAHVPADDVAYKGGVDVQGRPVKPADLAPAPDLGLKDRITFQLILDVIKENRSRQFQHHPGLRGEIYLGWIVIKDGVVTLDGKPLAARNRQYLYEFCQKSRDLP